MDVIDVEAQEVFELSDHAEPEWKQKARVKRESARYNMGRLLRTVKDGSKRFYRRHRNMILSFLIIVVVVAAYAVFMLIYFWLINVNVWLALGFLLIMVWLFMWWMMADEERQQRKRRDRIEALLFM